MQNRLPTGRSAATSRARRTTVPTLLPGPSLVTTHPRTLHASIAKGMVNVLAIAAATEITFEAKPVKALMAASSYFKDEERITNKTETRQDSWNIYN